MTHEPLASIDTQNKGKSLENSRQKSCCIQILGMHRSGTSMLARTLNILGTALPKSLMGAAKSNEKGHWESNRLVQYHDTLLERMGSRWDDWRSLNKSHLSSKERTDVQNDHCGLLNDEFGTANFFVVKDPRICRFFPLFSDSLDAFGSETKIILPFRNPLDVSDSLETRNNLDRVDASLLWLRHVLEAEFSTRHHPRIIVNYADFLSDWRGVIDQVSESLKIDWPNKIDDVATEITSFIDPSLNHHKHTTEDILLDPVLRHWVGGAFEALMILSQNPKSKKALKTLDDIRKSFDESAIVLYALKNHADTRLKLQHASNHKETAAQNQKLNEADNETKKLSHTVSMRTAELADVRKKFAQKQKAEQRLEVEIQVKTLRLDDLKQTHATHISDLQKDLAAKAETEASLRAELAVSRALAEDGVKSHAEETAKHETHAAKNQQDIIRVQSELAAKDTLLSHLESQNKDLNNQLNKSRIHHDKVISRLKQKCEKKDAQIKILGQNISRIEDEKNVLRECANRPWWKVLFSENQS